MLDWWDAFSKREKGAVVGGSLFAVLWGVLIYYLGPEQAPKMGDPVGFLYSVNEWGAVLVLTLAGLYATYSAVKGIGGTFGRGIAVVGVGYIAFAILQIPHAVFHGEGTHGNFFGLGLSVGGLDIFFHVFSGLFALYMAYGFYLTYRAATGGGSL